MTQDILHSNDNGVLTIRLNRAEKRNAITFDMYRQMSELLTEAQTDDSVSAILFTAEGESFCAGNDLGDFMKLAQGSTDVVDTDVVRFLMALAENKKPAIAAVQGKAVGIGLTLTLHCDAVIVSEDAQLSVPFVALGLVPEAASSMLLPRMIGMQRASKLLLLGHKVSAKEAVDWGMAIDMTSGGELLERANQVAAHFAKLPKTALKESRALIRGNTDEVREKMIEEAKIFGERLRSKEAQQAFMAFLSR